MSLFEPGNLIYKHSCCEVGMFVTQPLCLVFVKALSCPGKIHHSEALVTELGWLSWECLVSIYKSFIWVLRFKLEFFISAKIPPSVYNITEDKLTIIKIWILKSLLPITKMWLSPMDSCIYIIKCVTLTRWLSIVLLRGYRLKE